MPNAPVDLNAVVGHLVWVKGLKGPVPEKWPVGDLVGGRAGKIELARHPLKRDEYGLAIAILEQRYPPPRQGE